MIDEKKEAKQGKLTNHVENETSFRLTSPKNCSYCRSHHPLGYANRFNIINSASCPAASVPCIHVYLSGKHNPLLRRSSSFF